VKVDILDSSLEFNIIVPKPLFPFNPIHMRNPSQKLLSFIRNIIVYGYFISQQKHGEEKLERIPDLY